MTDLPVVSAVFGTRPEIIKLWPVINSLRSAGRVRVECLYTGQQADLAPDFLSELSIEIDAQLDVMRDGQSLPQLLASTVAGLSTLLERDRPDAIVVQGDTMTTLSAALAGRMLQIPIVHIEAGLRTGDPNSPFPEESNRKIISQLASLHCAPTKGNVRNLLNEGIDERTIKLTGNPIVDAIEEVRTRLKPSDAVMGLTDKVATDRLIVLTAHRRENFETRLAEYFGAIRKFVEGNNDVSVVFPQHPNPPVGTNSARHLSNHPRIHVTDPLKYNDFIYLMERAWIILSDSGGVQEEAATLRKPMIILRQCTERPEIIDNGVAVLAESGDVLLKELSNLDDSNTWVQRIVNADNPYGDGNAAAKISNAIQRFLGVH